MLTAIQRLELAWPAEAMLPVVDHGADAKDPSVLQMHRLLVLRKHDDRERQAARVC